LYEQQQIALGGLLTLVPLAFALGKGAEMQRPLAIESSRAW
jgi:Cu/Ag efflux pump CusA